MEQPWPAGSALPGSILDCNAAIKLALTGPNALPALWAIRQALPRAELHCIANARWSSLLRIAPWIDRVWDYHERPKAIQASDLALARLIRRERFDACINLMGSNRSCIISRLSGARYRLGRKPFEEHRPAWRRFNTDVMEYPYRGEPRYLQKWRCLQQAGIACAAPHFEIELRSVTPPADPGEEHRATYLHISPYASAGQKELPPQQMADLLVALHAGLPQFRLVVSSSCCPREIAALEALLMLLPFKPWRVYAGTLDAAQLFRVIDGAVLHLGPDTGSLHLAWVAGTAAVCWSAGNLREWVPRGSAGTYPGQRRKAGGLSARHRHRGHPGGGEAPDRGDRPRHGKARIA